jgi:carbon storage regulator
MRGRQAKKAAVARSEQFKKSYAFAVGMEPTSTRRSVHMLILTRRVGESVLIGDEIEIVVTAIGFDQVRIGFDTPREVEIVRSELREQRNRKLVDRLE